MSETKHNKKKVSPVSPDLSGKKGFSLVECVIALVILMVASLAVIGVLNFALNQSESSRRRTSALFLAKYYMEDLRNTPFNNLTAGKVTQNNIVYDGVKFTLFRTIADVDVLTVDEAYGPEEKNIIVTIAPVSSYSARETVTLQTVRANNRPGPNRESNTPK
jgi:Tfp pilus assembly protein PilV